MITGRGGEGVGMRSSSSSSQKFLVSSLPHSLILGNRDPGREIMVWNGYICKENYCNILEREIKVIKCEI